MQLFARASLRCPALFGMACLVLFGPALQAQELGTVLNVSTPPYGAYVHDVPIIRGSWNRYRSDNQVWASYSVDLRLTRKSDNRCWDGSAWGNPYDWEWLDASHYSDGSWRVTDPRPARAQLQDGWYGVDVRETRTAPYTGTSWFPPRWENLFGVSSTERTAMSLFFVDNTPPALLTISMPPDGGRQSTANQIRGLAEDGPFRSGLAQVASGLARVGIAVRQGDLYWDGAAWVGTETRFNATLNATAWSVSDRMPGRGQLTLGLTYRIEATAEDQAHNTLSVTNSFLADRDTPELSVGAPASGDVVDVLSELSGTAIDSDGVVRVEVLLRRVGDGLFWSPLARNWSAARSVFTLVPNSRGIWSRTQGLPVGAELEEVEYEVLVTAFDQFGYENATSSRFTVDRSPPEVATLELAGALGDLNNIAGRLPTRGLTAGRTNSVQMSLQRQSDSAYWDGTKWTAQESFLDTRLMGDIWTLSSRMPQPREFAGESANAGIFSVRTLTMDALGHRTLGQSQTVSVDAMPPDVRVIAPQFGVSITAPQSEPGIVLEARERDNDPVKSGVEHVVIALSRNHSGVTEYWQWSSAQWGLQPFYNPAAPQAGNPDRWQHVVPDLPPGDYLVFASAMDRTGNVGMSSEMFRVSGPPGPMISIDSPADGTLTGNPLVFAGRASDASGVAGVYVILSRFSGNTRLTYDWARNDFFVYNDPGIQEPTRQAQGTGAWRIEVPAAIELGTYEVSATAVNALSEATEIRSEFLVIDLMPPQVGILYPANGTPDLSILNMTGSVRDDQPGAQAYVSVMRYRIASPPEYLDWTHGRWTTEWNETDTRRNVIPDVPSASDPQLSFWTISLADVADANGNSLFQQGNYAALASAVDAAGNTSALTLNEFTIADPLPPQVAITTPTAGAFVGTLGALAGTAVDNAGGSGVGRVEIRLFRPGDATYWNGTGWQAAPAFVRAELGDGTWTYHQGPQGNDLTTGDYYVEVFAYDQTTRNNFVGITVRADRTTPQTLFIAEPVHESVLTDLPLIRGILEDDVGGSGPDRVEVLVQRDSDGQWWDGNAWGAIQTAHPTTLNGTEWVANFSAPPRALLTGGTYTVFAIGFDAVGNRIGVSVRVTVPSDTTGPIVIATHPAPGSIVQSLATIAGTVTDPGGTVSSVRLSILRDSDQNYWTGTSWVSVGTTQPAVIEADRWKSERGPDGDDLAADHYTLTVLASDAAGNETMLTYGVTVVASTTTWLGPTPYLSLNDSPFLGLSLESFTVETFEDGLFNVPGVDSNVVPDPSPAHPRGVVGPLATPTPVTDSVDGDDGAMDGSGLAGHSFFNVPGVIEFSFNAAVLGRLPTHVGLVFTDGQNPVVFEAFDAEGNSLGRITGSHADESMNGETGEDRFYGVIGAEGISRVRLSAAGALEVDHLQFGYAVADTVPPAVTFTDPADQAVLREFPVIRGTASDSSGLRQIEVVLLRNADLHYWNGTAWSPIQSMVPAVVSPDGSWALAAVPAGILLPEGLYTLNAFATDLLGNVGAAGITVRIEAPIPSEPPRLTAIEPLGSGKILLRALGTVATTYRVELSEDLKDWTEIGIATANGDGLLEFTDPVVRDQGYYRLVAP